MKIERIQLDLADYKPTLDFISAVNFAQNDATSTQVYQYKNNQIGLQYSIPKYLGDGISASVKQEKLGYEASIAETEVVYLKKENEF